MGDRGDSVILSHRHRFIFIKTEKTAGTSIEIALSRVCGPEDVITFLAHPEDRALKASLGPGYRNAQHDLVPLSKHTPLDLAQAVARRRLLRFENHMGAADIRRFVDPEVWESYFKFCVERNPWDKVVSAYWWWRHLESQYRDDPAGFTRGLGRYANGMIRMIQERPIGDMSLSEFVQSGRANLVRGFDLYSIEGEVAVDRVLRFERLEEELRSVAEHLGIRDLPPLPRAKSGSRPMTAGYREVLSPADRDRIARVFAREIVRFDYEF